MVRFPRSKRLYILTFICFVLISVNYFLIYLLNRPHQDPIDLTNTCFLQTWRDDLSDAERKCFGDCCMSNETILELRLNCIFSCKPSLHQWFTVPTRHFHFLPINIIPKANKKIISISLYGSAHRYLANSFKIIKKNHDLYPDWILRFYVAADVPPLAINRLISQGSEVISVYQRQNKDGFSLPDSYHGMFWRFFVADDVNVERFIVRDADSFPIQRELDAVNQWIEEGTRYHIMRDSVYHEIEILGGMWGGRVNTSYLNVSELYDVAMSQGYSSKDGRDYDQYFLLQFLWPIVKPNMTCHISNRFWLVDDEGCKSFPTQRKKTEFVGDIIP